VELCCIFNQWASLKVLFYREAERKKRRPGAEEGHIRCDMADERNEACALYSRPQQKKNFQECPNESHCKITPAALLGEKPVP
jgi:hypothetical protein